MDTPTAGRLHDIKETFSISITHAITEATSRSNESSQIRIELKTDPHYQSFHFQPVFPMYDSS